MSAKAGQYFPLSVLFELLHVDGKERVLPVLRQMETVPVQMAEMEAQNADLKRLCEEAGGLMGRQRAGAQAQKEVIARLEAEREAMQAEMAAMREELERRKDIEEAGEVE